MYLIWVSVVVLFATVTAEPTEDEKFIDCAHKYLSLHDLNNFKKYMNYTPSTDDDPECPDLLKKYAEGAYEEFQTLFATDSENLPKIDCIMKNLRFFNASDEYYATYLYKNNQYMTVWKRKQAMAEATSGLMIKVEAALDRCFPEREFGIDFDELFEDNETNREEENEEKESKLSEHDIIQEQTNYCWRKHIVDKGVLDTQIYSLELNPQNVTVDGLDCDTVWKYTSKIDFQEMLNYYTGLFTSPSDSAVECVEEKIRTSNYIDSVALATFLDEVELTPEQKETERKKMIDFDSKLFEEALKCLETDSSEK